MRECTRRLLFTKEDNTLWYTEILALNIQVFYFGKEELVLGSLEEIPSFSAILTGSGTDFASILRINWLRWTFTVASLAFISAAICLLRRPEMESVPARLFRGYGRSGAHDSAARKRLCFVGTQVAW